MRRVELGHLNHPAYRDRADLPVHGVAGAFLRWTFGDLFPAFKAGHELRITIGVADGLPDGVGIGVDDATALHAHQVTRFFAQASPALRAWALISRSPGIDASPPTG